MDVNKLEISGKTAAVGDPARATATYKQIPEADLEEQAMSRPKNLVKPEPNVKGEGDGADEKMLPDEEKKISPNSNIGLADVKFTVNEKQNGDAKLDIATHHGPYGLTKEELAKYADDPMWIKIRWALFILFWLAWASMFVGAIFIIYYAPKCTEPEPKTWWEKGPIAWGGKFTPWDYMIGFLKQSKDNGAQAVIASWPEDSYAAQNISDGFQNVMKEANETDMKLIVELKPTFSTFWFNESENGIEPYKDYYIWKKPLGFNSSNFPIPPNNWLDKSNNSAWIYSNKRKEFYYAPEGRPHLNFRNPDVVKEFSAVLKNFLQNGVQGFSLSGTPNLLVDSNFENEEVNKFVVGNYLNDYNFYLHSKTTYLEEIGPIIKEWSNIVKSNTKNGLFMLTENDVKLDPYIVNKTLYIDLPRVSNIFSSGNLTAGKIVRALNRTNLLNITWPLWEHGNKELPPDVLDIVTFLLPGTVLIDSNSTVPKELLELRQSPSILYGLLEYYEVANGTVFAFIRVTSGNPGILVALNPTDSSVTVNFLKEIPVVADELLVKFFSRNYNETNIMLKKKISAESVPISAKSAIVLSYVPKLRASEN